MLPAVIHVVQLLTRTPDVTPDEYYAASAATRSRAA